MMKIALATLLSVTMVSATSQAVNEANARRVNNLLRSAQAIRRLNEQENRNEEFAVDISGYSVKFEQCQFVKSYDDELAEAEESDTVLGTTRFAVFRLCPGNSCDSCNTGYGEYIVDLETYLQVSTEYFQEYQQEMCNTCDQYCEYEQQQYENMQNGYNEAQEYNEQNDQENQYNGENQENQNNEENQDNGENDGENQEDGQNQEDGENGGENQDNGERRFLNDQNNQNQKPYGLNCNKCVKECAKIENMEENGYVDATEFLQCQKIYDDGNQNGLAYYAAPVCAQAGSRIKIGVFSDEYCSKYQYGLNVEDYLDQDGDGNGKQLSHALLKLSYEDTCISCKEAQENGNNNEDNDARDADQVNEFCENLYGSAGKCEYTHGFSGAYQVEGNDFYNQMAQEDVVCDFIQSLKAGTYDETGEINISGSSFSFAGGTNTTTGQKIALAFFSLGTIGLAIYAAMLHSKLTRGIHLTRSTGSLA